MEQAEADMARNKGDRLAQSTARLGVGDKVVCMYRPQRWI
jgi:hypothetical protein